MENVITGGASHNTQPQASRGAGLDGQFFTLVNGTKVSFKDPTPKGDHILDKAGAKPAGDYVLIQLLRHGSRSVGLDETVDLRMEGTEEFRAFKGDRIFRFTLNGHSYEWGVNAIPEPELRLLCHVHSDEALVVERDGTDIDLGPNDVLDLDKAGTEHLYTEKRLITVFFENDPREIPRGTYSTQQLKQLFAVQEGYVLEYINNEGHLMPLKPEGKLRVKDGMKFFEQVPCGGSS
ncbi:multiubiquitin domain-containing protein [Methylovirgula sp. 4M-Z18]|uniref:multiubiquitin domain-containing protein n=1 Tax=Methylovirgula sp. 4M-Z18 TaxID=2293567 RepID=UPI000E2E9C53|nr:multiubiquitin domain-containing protein [Methylovirgula sp. 4M-Z18]RFB76608.1 hypothetical protein DYH55_19260 [Methylovirgula sp. 4M-Z18]